MLAACASWVAPAWAIDAAGAVVFTYWQQYPPLAISAIFGVMLWLDLFNPEAWAINYVLGWLMIIMLFLWAAGSLQQNPARVPTS